MKTHRLTIKPGKILKQQLETSVTELETTRRSTKLSTSPKDT